MGACYKSLREFAKLAKISPQRLRTLIDAGKVTVHEGGMIHISQLNYFMKERLLNCISTRGGGTLYVTIDKSEEEIASFKSGLPEGVIVVSNIDELLGNLSKESIDKTMELAGRNALETRYKKLVLKEFVKRMKAALQRHLMKYCEDIEISQISLGYVYELMLYSNIYSCIIDDIDLAKRMCREPMTDMRLSFEAIVSNLNLYDATSGDPLFTQEDITPDFISTVENFEDDLSIPSDGVLYDIFRKNFCMGEDAHGRGKDSQKIIEILAGKISNMAKATMLSNIVSNGFCSFLNIRDGISNEEICRVSSDLAAGFYSEVRFLCSKEYVNENLSDALALMFNSLAVAHRLRITYN